ncbi:Shikimate dehydrogenase (NADP(+)) [Fundidesulfovibrio magnetotacticus]|uniref:Shikimate dehydrogenase (NADP(+)) n=1 Tax=Fundidesulfovibrio magnetotacticus TaxID=2730080 RepID=A0A6V8LSX0_9BACT|nr:shikimate dehydrogenase [Fundidesulfovibrio magnetotacticus]GFK92906.1 Shikimate dehydrogenase (NADP(+)) [Fundidesulfovibrio magnetotacticus]
MLHDSTSPRIPEKLFGIIGHPLGQTLSPLLHNWGYERLGLPFAFMAFPTPPERLGALMRAARALPLSGLSVTIPHKQAVMEHLERFTLLATRTGAVNTVYWEDGRLVGHNTDVEGFMAPLEGRKDLGPVLVLGAGGAARAVLAGLAELGAGPVTVCNRDGRRAESLASQFGAQAEDWEARARVQARLVVNTTPLGMAGKAVGLSPMPAGYWSAGQVAYDLVYNPAETAFLREARAGGAQTVDGLAMFAGQAVAQFRLWTGRELPLDEVRAVLAGALGL